MKSDHTNSFVWYDGPSYYVVTIYYPTKGLDEPSKHCPSLHDINSITNAVDIVLFAS